MPNDSLCLSLFVSARTKVSVPMSIYDEFVEAGLSSVRRLTPAFVRQLYRQKGTFVALPILSERFCGLCVPLQWKH